MAKHSPRERLSLDRNWRFALGHAADDSRDFGFARTRSLVKAGEDRGAASPAFDDSKWRIVNLPHDWAIELPLDPKGDKELCEHGFVAIGPDHPENSVGWYRRSFEIPKSDQGRRIWIEFEGVFRDSVTWINGHWLGRHRSGYTSFRFDLTDYVNYGGKNVLTVRADASTFEGWWYEGAGIYRHVWLHKTNPIHVAPNGTFITTKLTRSRAVVTARITITNDSDDSATLDVGATLVSPSSSRAPGRATQVSPLRLAPWSTREITQRIPISNPKLWSPDSPNLYTFHTTLCRAAKILDLYPTTFGIRTFRFDSRKGFFLNNQTLKIKGTCNHQSHAGVGTAMPDRLHQLRIEKLKALGSNAYRCSHYAASPALLDACDRLGMLVLAENRLAGSSPQILGDFESMILRDRNRPCIFAWSIANEEHTIQWSRTGERIGRTMVRRAHQLDPTRPVTAAMHDRGLGEGFANIVDLHGWNYIKVGDIDAFHRRRPAQPILGTEEASTLTTRGIYADDPARGYVSAYDRRTPKWGSTAESWWTFYEQRPWLPGAFVWTGFDYRGEPTPYKWPCTGSHFGLMDACGFPKDIYYYYQSWWTNPAQQTVLHLFPHWTWPGREGQLIEVCCFSNCDEVELLLNGKTLDRKPMPRNSHLCLQVPYECGTLQARGFRSGKPITTTTVETTATPAALTMSADRLRLRANGADLAAVTVQIVDAKGRFVPTANNSITFTVTGAGHLLGVGNGDPSSHESDKSNHRRAFNGLCLALVQSTDQSGRITLAATSPGLVPARLKLTTVNAPRITS